MTRSSTGGASAEFEQRAVAASTAHRSRYRAAYGELSLVHESLVAEAALLAATIEERLIPRRIE